MPEAAKIRTALATAETRYQNIRNSSTDPVERLDRLGKVVRETIVPEFREYLPTADKRDDDDRLLKMVGFRQVANDTKGQRIHVYELDWSPQSTFLIASTLGNAETAPHYHTCACLFVQVQGETTIFEYENREDSYFARTKPPTILKPGESHIVPANVCHFSKSQNSCHLAIFAGPLKSISGLSEDGKSVPLLLTQSRQLSGAQSETYPVSRDQLVEPSELGHDKLNQPRVELADARSPSPEVRPQMDPVTPERKSRSNWFNGVLTPFVAPGAVLVAALAVLGAVGSFMYTAGQLTEATKQNAAQITVLSNDIKTLTTEISKLVATQTGVSIQIANVGTQIANQTTQFVELSRRIDQAMETAGNRQESNHRQFQQIQETITGLLNRMNPPLTPQPAPRR